MIWSVTDGVPNDNNVEWFFLVSIKYW